MITGRSPNSEDLSWFGAAGVRKALCRLRPPSGSTLSSRDLACVWSSVQILRNSAFSFSVCYGEQPPQPSREFGEINLEQDELERLRTMVRDGNPRPFDFYPVDLLQIVQNGLPHNLGPFATDISFRFYFDGLIAHMFRKLDLEFKQIERLMVGSSSTLVVQTRLFADSRRVTRVGACRRLDR